MPPHMSCTSEQWGKQCNDYYLGHPCSMWVDGAIIVGAGPSGMATAACLQQMGVRSSVILEKSDCIAALWQQRTYDRLCLHIPKQFCELPLAPFPSHFPTYPTRQQFVQYLQDYALNFHVHPKFSERVQSASYDARFKVWRVQTACACGPKSCSNEYIGRWLVVATGENAEARVPVDLPGFHLFQGKFKHSSDYKNGGKYQGQNVLVVGSGNSGMEIALDLVQHDAKPSIVVRSPIHILPREIFGRSTFAVAMLLLKLLPLWLTDRLLVIYALLALGDTSKYGIKRPKRGPMEIKEKMGRTPVLDVGTLSYIKNGDIKVEPGIERFTCAGAKFVNGEQHAYDAVIFATGYKSNVPKWLKDPDVSFSCDGFPKCGWKADKGLYVAGLSRKGIMGASRDAQLIADDIRKAYFVQQNLTHSQRK